MGMRKTLAAVPEGFFEEAEKQTGLLEWAGAKTNVKGKLVPKKKTRRKTIAAAVFTRTRAETESMMETGEWESCSARHIVALYDLMHVKVYGVDAGMTSQERHIATVRTGPFVTKEFGGDYEQAIEFFRWVWKREMSKEKWRRENEIGSESGARLTIWAMISSRTLTDYRVSLLRKKT